MDSLEWILLVFLAIFAIGSIVGYMLFVKNEKNNKE
ncbi:Uncharacterised protein [Helicobacter canis]|uniref:Uncharacterized protein n=1 Tax=Helicobacter canis TaxID=29419 RepID=A0A377J4E8_9HELI|nr:Uncharacterised protein [Helicobacter canis]